MIAEIKGKLSRSGSNLSERLEDNLTGNFFGSLRYLPFNKALKQILVSGIQPDSVKDAIKYIDAENWDKNIKFWYRDSNSELDVLLEFEDTVIGIEVKLFSGLSSDDDIDNSDTSDTNDAIDTSESCAKDILKESVNQLSREARTIIYRGKDKTKLLLFIADDYYSKYIYSHINGRKIIADGIELCYISWQTILEELCKLKLDNGFEGIIINDLIDLLKRKNFERFKNFEVSYSINSNVYFEFIDLKQEYFNFDIDLKISRGEYYEFK